jgi:Flp pilus assembly pilin Flp
MGHLEWLDRSNAERVAERGQGLAEYALILSLIVVVAIAALVFLGTNISSILSTIAQSI